MGVFRKLFPWLMLLVGILLGATGSAGFFRSPIDRLIDSHRALQITHLNSWLRGLQEGHEEAVIWRMEYLLDMEARHLQTFGNPDDPETGEMTRNALETAAAYRRDYPEQPLSESDPQQETEELLP